MGHKYFIEETNEDVTEKFETLEANRHKMYRFFILALKLEEQSINKQHNIKEMIYRISKTKEWEDKLAIAQKEEFDFLSSNNIMCHWWKYGNGQLIDEGIERIS